MAAEAGRGAASAFLLPVNNSFGRFLRGRGRVPSFAAMNRFAAPLLAAALLAAPALPLVAQDAAEEIRRLNATTESLTEGLETLRGQLQALRQEVSQLKSENAALKQRLAGVGQDNVSRAELVKVIESVREVDTKRQSDAQLVQRQLKDLAELAAKPIQVPSEPPPTNKKRDKPAEPAPIDRGIDHQTPLPTEGYEHVVASGESIGAIIQAYNQKYSLKVKTADVLRANPKLKDPKKIFVGQKLWIPEVK